MQQKIQKLINDAITHLQDNETWSHFSVPEIIVERPKEYAHGDWTSNVAFMLSKKIGKAPNDIAGEIAQTMKAQKVDDVEHISAMGGYINIALMRRTLTSQLSDVVENGDAYGSGASLVGKEVMVEFTDPNPFKALHIGHVMSNAIGESIARLFSSQGATVIRANFYGDVGLHVAKALWGIQNVNDGVVGTANDLGHAYAAGAKAYEEDESAQKEIIALNKKVYNHDESISGIYEEGKAVSLAHFEEIYKIVGTKFDRYYPESETGPIGQKIVEEHIDDVFSRSDGAIIFDGEKEDLHTRVFINKEGLPTYEAKDVGLLAQKFKDYPHLHTSLTVTGNEITEYFKVVLAAAKKIDASWVDRTQHLPHGMLQLTSGKMSSRSGNIISGEDLIKKARALAAKKMSERASGEESKDVIDAIAVAGIKFSILKQHYGKNITFDPETALSFDGDSGPYIQYTHVRCKSIAAKAEVLNENDVVSMVCDDAVGIERMIDRYSETVSRATDERAPHYIAQYALDLAHEFNAYYNNHQIIDEDHRELSIYRMLLTQAVGQILKNSLHLLGIKSPERM